MITPKFKLSQSDSELEVTVYAPFAHLADTEISIDENIFIFYSSPYYLRLNLPGKLVDSEKEVHKSIFHADEGAFLITCMKQTFGEFFPNLDMLTDLLTPKGSSSVNKPVIEVLSGTTENDENDDDNDDVEFFFEQTLPDDSITTEGYKYGFANFHSNVFATLRSEFLNLVDIVDPDSKPVSERKKERLKNEKESFSESHYLADLFEQDIILPSLHFEPSFHKLQKENVQYTSTEEETLLKLPRKELLIDKGSKSHIYMALVDILFSWCYDHRVTVGETCTESAWNIRKLSSTLSWLDTFCSLKNVISCSVRRSLVFPLMRNWELSLLVLQDTIKVLSLGKKQVLKCFLEIHYMFNNYEPYYVLNQLYIADFCVWIQTIKEEHLLALADSLKKVKITKDDMHLELVELERAAGMVVQEEEEAKQKKAEEETANREKVEEENLNNLVESLGAASVIENALAMARNDNDTETGVMFEGDGDYHGSVPYSAVTHGMINNTDDLSDDSTDDSSDDSEDSDSSDSDDDDSSSSSSSGSLDSDDDADDDDEVDDTSELILKNLKIA